jgi:hypothetical protein
MTLSLGILLRRIRKAKGGHDSSGGRGLPSLALNERYRDISAVMRPKWSQLNAEHLC